MTARPVAQPDVQRAQEVAPTMETLSNVLVGVVAPAIPLLYGLSGLMRGAIIVCGAGRGWGIVRIEVDGMTSVAASVACIAFGIYIIGRWSPFRTDRNFPLFDLAEMAGLVTSMVALIAFIALFMPRVVG